MNWFDILYWVLIVLSAVGVICGIIKLTKMRNEKLIGNLVIAEDALEDNPYVFMEFRVPPETLKNGEIGYVVICRKNIS